MATDLRLAGTVVSDGHLTVLETLIERGITLHLYTNARVTQLDDRQSVYTEPVVAGYAPVALDKNPANWELTRGTPSRAFAKEVEFRFRAGGLVIIGYFLVAGPRLYGVMPLQEPFKVLNPGDALAVRPILVQGA